MEFLLIVGLMILAITLTAVARRVGGPSTDRFVNVDPTRSDYPITTGERASELSEAERLDVSDRRNR